MNRIHLVSWLLGAFVSSAIWLVTSGTQLGWVFAFVCGVIHGRILHTVAIRHLTRQRTP